MVFDHIRKSGLKLNAAKCVFGVNELTVLGTCSIGPWGKT